MITDLDNKDKRPLLSHTLRKRATSMRTWLCVGIDPDVTRLPGNLPKNAAGVERFCLDIVAATSGMVPAYKLNFGFFEALGPFGWRVLERVRAALPADSIAIADAKRGDIGSTSTAYARAIFDTLAFDAVTVSPYLGWDALEPFTAYQNKLVYVLCKTSNPGASTYQDLQVDGDPLYLRVARDAASQRANADIGLVVGATQQESLTRIRRELPDVSLLVPGVGAQGAAAATVMPVVHTNAVIPVSRQILGASNGPDYAEAAANEVRRLSPLCWYPDAG